MLSDARFVLLRKLVRDVSLGNSSTTLKKLHPFPLHSLSVAWMEAVLLVLSLWFLQHTRSTNIYGRKMK